MCVIPCTNCMVTMPSRDSVCCVINRDRRAVDIAMMKTIESKLRSENDRSKLNGFEPTADTMFLDLCYTLCILKLQKLSFRSILHDFTLFVKRNIKFMWKRTL